MLLFSDARPNVGETGAGSFHALFDGRIDNETFSLILDDAAGGYGADGFNDVDIRKGSTLINQAEAMITACEAFHIPGDVSKVLKDVYDPALARLTAEAQALGSEALAEEVALMEHRRSNLVTGH